MKCKICGNEEGQVAYVVREMMFGLHDEFNYFQCSQCDCLQIVDIPKDMSRYYPSNYYSYKLETEKSGIFSALKRIRDRYAVFNQGLLGKCLYQLKGDSALRSLAAVTIFKDSRILDVGCGSGNFLLTLNSINFKHLLGVDPYIEKDIDYGNGVKVEKKELKDVSAQQDLIMLHHSFEHMDHPLEIMQNIARLLVDNGACIIRIPTVDSFAWRTYRTNWVQLDAPRHFFLHSRKSMDLLAEQAGLVVKEVIYDANGFQFWGSERYKRGISLRDTVDNATLFGKETLKQFEKQAIELNLKKDGDACAYILTKKIGKAKD